MKQFLFFNAFLLLSVITLAQAKRDRYGEYKKNADSLLTTIIDKGIFTKYVQFQVNKSYYSKEGDKPRRMVSFSKQADWTPDFYTFFYNFSHPGFSGHRFPIVITLDRSGKFAPRMPSCGLVIIPDSLDAVIVSKKMALKSFREIGSRDKAYRSSIQLVWYNEDKNDQGYESVRELAESNSIKWRVRGTVLFRDGKRYRGNFLIDALTGDLERRFAIPWD